MFRCGPRSAAVVPAHFESPVKPDPAVWKVFNVQLRLLGMGAIFAGLVALVTYGMGWPPLPGEAPARSVGAMVGGGLVALLGFGFLMLKPYRPDLGDTRLLLNLYRRTDSRRWWTGDPTG